MKQGILGDRQICVVSPEGKFSEALAEGLEELGACVVQEPRCASLADSELGEFDLYVVDRACLNRKHRNALRELRRFVKLVETKTKACVVLACVATLETKEEFADYREAGVREVMDGSRVNGQILASILSTRERDYARSKLSARISFLGKSLWSVLFCLLGALIAALLSGGAVRGCIGDLRLGSNWTAQICNTVCGEKTQPKIWGLSLQITNNSSFWPLQGVYIKELSSTNCKVTGLAEGKEFSPIEHSRSHTEHFSVEHDGSANAMFTLVLEQASTGIKVSLKFPPESKNPKEASSMPESPTTIE